MTGSAVFGIGRRAWVAVAGGWVVMGGLAGPVMAQAVEEHPAQTLLGPQAFSLTAADFADRPDDPTPFGVALAGLVVVDGNANGGKLVRHSATGGIDTSFGGPTAQNAALRRLLAKYLGQPLSFRLLSAIQSDVTQFYRDNGRSLVSVTVPQQEITSGVVQINVTAFRLAGTAVAGADAEARAFITQQVRLKPGQEVDTDRLLEDVNWLNQNPFRHVSVVFAPGQAQGSTNLTLQVQTAPRTWSGYVGMSNAGTEDTGVVRLFGGFNISALSWKDQQLSYQFTGSPDSLAKGRLWDTGTDKGYLSHSLGYFIPITTNSGFRTKLSFGASHISSYSEPGGVFTSGSETGIATAELSFPLRKTGGRFTMVPEVYAQLELNQYDRLQYFGGVPITEENTRLLHLALGVRTSLAGPTFGKPSRGSADVALVLGQRDTEGFASSTYRYVTVDLKHEVFVERDRSVAFRVSGQSSGDPLHALEQMALGGDGTVRGYPVNGVSASTAVAASLEYRMPEWSFTVGGQEGSLRPHVFADVGWADDDEQNLASVGFGGDFEVGKNVVGSLNIANALEKTATTAANTTSIAFQLTARF